MNNIKEKRGFTTRLLPFFVAIVLCCTACHFPRDVKDIKSPQPDTAAYENIHFGISVKEYVQTIKDTITFIDNSVYTILPDFTPTDNKLYRLILNSREIPHDKFDTRLQDDMKILIQKFTALYGNPGKWHEIPAIDQFEQGAGYWNCVWEYPNKQIKIGIIRLKDKNDEKNFFAERRFYQAVCLITNKKLADISMQRSFDADMLREIKKLTDKK